MGRTRPQDADALLTKLRDQNVPRVGAALATFEVKMAANARVLGTPVAEA